MNQRTYHHIFFDLDHTLWDFETNSKRTLENVFFDFDLSEKISASFDDFFKHYSVHNKTLWERYQKGFISAEELKWRRMWRTLLEFKIGDEELSKKMSESFLENLPKQKGMFPYAHEILTYLKEKNYYIHLITNGFEKTQRSKIINSGIDHFFTHVITSEASMSMKPEKAIFEYAVNKAGTSMEYSVMIGDDLEADISGALNAGMDAIFVNHINETTTLKPTHTIYQLQELENIL
jgi:putative hydrolase of the HAD superfamily